MKVETLKDLKEHKFKQLVYAEGVPDSEHEVELSGFVKKDDLRELAMKWIHKIMVDFKMEDKELPFNVHLNDEGILTFRVNMVVRKLDKREGTSMIAWIMYVFNITKGDLFVSSPFSLPETEDLRR